MLLFVAPTDFPGVNIFSTTHFKLPVGSWKRQKSTLSSQYDPALQHHTTVSRLGPCRMYWNLLSNFYLLFLTSAPTSLLVFCVFFFFSFLSSPSLLSLFFSFLFPSYFQVAGGSSTDVSPVSAGLFAKLFIL